MGLGLRPAIVVPSVVVLVVCSVIPTFFAYNLWLPPFPAAAYAKSFMLNPLILIFPLAAAMPYVPFFGSLVTNRFLVYTRPRQAIRSSLARHFLVNSVLAFTTFFLVGIVPGLFVTYGSVRYAPGDYYLETQQQIDLAEQSWTTFSQFAVHGPWGFPLAFSMWLDVNAVLYSCISLSLSLMTRNRILPIVVPWLVSFVLSFAFAITGFQAYSLLLIFPFNLQQLALTNMLYPLGMVFVTAAGLMGYVFTNAPSLKTLQ